MGGGRWGGVVWGEAACLEVGGERSRVQGGRCGGGIANGDPDIWKSVTGFTGGYKQGKGRKFGKAGKSVRAESRVQA